MRLSAARALLSVLILVVLGETTAGATPDEWLREWLRKLAVKIPPQTVRSTFVSVTLSDLTCTGFAVGTVSSELGARNEASVEVAVAGVGCECSGTWTIDSALSTEEARESWREWEGTGRLGRSPCSALRANARRPAPRPAMFTSFPSPLPEATLDLPVEGVNLAGSTLRDELAVGPVLLSSLRHFG